MPTHGLANGMKGSPSRRHSSPGLFFQLVLLIKDSLVVNADSMICGYVIEVSEDSHYRRTCDTSAPHVTHQQHM
jgi:hypothetical protein